MMAAPHFGFVVAAYAFALVVVLAMIGAIVWDYRAQSEALRRLEAATQRERRGVSEGATVSRAGAARSPCCRCSASRCWRSCCSCASMRETPRAFPRR